MKNKKIVLLVAAATVFGLVSCGGGEASSSVVSSSSQVVSSSSIASSSVEASSSESSVVVSQSSLISSESSVISSESLSSSEESLDASLQGEGTEESPYLISNRAQLAAFAEGSKEAYYKLTADIDFGGREWAAVGTKTAPFTGTFDGDGHKIKNLKVSVYDEEQTYYGFFGYTSKAHIKNFVLDDMEIDLQVTGTDTFAIVGSINAIGVNTSIFNVKVNLKKYNVVSSQKSSDEGAYIYGGGAVGYMAANANYFVKCEAVTVNGDVTINPNAKQVSIICGGVVGLASTSSGKGIIGITNCKMNGKVLGGSYTGGIAGYLDYYSSVSDSFVLSDKVYSTDAQGAYVGGVVGFANWDSAVVNTCVIAKEIFAPSSFSSYKSFAGSIAGYYRTLYSALNYYGEYQQGLTIGNSICNSNVKLDGDYDIDDCLGLASGDYIKKNLHWNSEVWDFSGALPEVKDAPASSLGEATVTLDANYEGDTDKTVTINAGAFNANLATEAVSTKIARSGYSFKGYFYDNEGEAPYCWYVPVNNSTTIYAAWSDVSEIAGSYSYECVYSEKVMGAGTWKFDDQKFYWVSSDYEVLVYDYMYDDDYGVIVIQDAYSCMSGAKGAYTDSVIVVKEDGTLTTTDINEGDAVYTATKLEGDVTLPDYTGNSVLGKWYASNGAIFDLYADSSVVSISTTSEVKYYGGFRVSDTSFNVSVFGKISGTFTYDADNQVIYNNNVVCFRSAITDTLATADGKVKVYVVGDNKVAFVEGVSYAVTGTVADGEKLTINNAEYTISGKVLTKVADVPSTPDPVVEKTYLGTWTGKSGMNTCTIVITADTLKFNSMDEVSYTKNGNVITATLPNGDALTLTYNESAQKLTGSQVEEYDDYNLEVSCTGYTAPATAEETPESTLPGYCGTYVVKAFGSQTAEFKLNSDGTMTWGAATGTYTVSGNKITGTLSCGYEIDLTWNADTKTLTGTWEDDDCTDHTFEYTSFTAETPKANTPAGENTIVGTWTVKVYGANRTLVINADGTASYDGNTAKAYTLTGNKFHMSVNGVDIDLTYDSANQTLSGTFDDGDNAAEMVSVAYAK